MTGAHEELPPNPGPAQGPAIEITRTATHEIRINRTFYDHDVLDALADELGARPDVSAAWDEEPIDSGVPDRRYFTLAIGDETYFAKVSERPGEDEEDRRRGAIELAFSKRVADLLETDEAQDIAARHGFGSVGFVEPLITVANLETGEEATIYRHQEGYAPEVPETDDEYEDPPPAAPGSELAALDDFCLELEDYLRRHGIDAHDLDPRQLIIREDSDGTKHLHLIDIERYRDLADSTGAQAKDLQEPADNGSIGSLQKGEHMADSAQGTYHEAVAKVTGLLEEHKGKAGVVAGDYDTEQQLARTARERYLELRRAFGAVVTQHSDVVMPHHGLAGEAMAGEGGVIPTFRREFPDREEKPYLTEADRRLNATHEAADGDGEDGSLRKTGQRIAENYVKVGELLAQLDGFFGDEQSAGALDNMLAGLPDDYRALGAQDDLVAETLRTQRAVS